MALSGDQERRYSRNIVLPEIGAAGQEKLLGAKVLVIGAGGLGSPLALYLAAAGIGTIGIADFDKVDLSNLQRQILFETADAGRLKTESARDALADLNPDIKVETISDKIDADNAEAIISEYDIIADGSDNFPTRFLVHDTCYNLGKTLVSAAVIGFTGHISTFKAHLGGGNPCYRCLYADIPPDEAESCADRGILGSVAGVLGSLQATEIVKELLAIGEGLSGSLLIYDALKGDIRKVALKPDVECKFCGHIAESVASNKLYHN